jgi:protein tyrosine phosphatase (PTP) superfamily phosphohydrolase (DUF442 family)
MRKKVFLWLLGLAAIALLSLGGFVLFNFFTSNFHTVIEHKVYRSAQLSPEELKQCIKKYHLKTILNLRNDGKNKPLILQEEKKIAQKYNLKYYNLKLPPQKLPDVQDLKLLVTILETAPKPILIHCKAGADRTGLASAISIILDDDRYLDDMVDQVSWQYNVYSNSTIGYQTIKNYLDWLAVNKKENSKENFLVWLNSVTVLKTYYGWFFT